MSRGETRLTEEQKIAVEFEGNNLLVSAAAGSGKTLCWWNGLSEGPLEARAVGHRSLLVVTFTEKAALK